MTHGLSEATRREINAIADRIARRQGLDDDVTRELQGHIEDKILGYLSGDVAVSETDALRLAETHFGDERRVKGLLGGVHEAAVSHRLLRRFAAGAIGHMIAGCLLLPVKLAAVLVIVFALSNDHPDTVRGIWSIGTMALATGTTVIYFLILRRWIRRERTGHRMWYETCSGWPLAAAVLLLIAITPVMMLITNHLAWAQVSPGVAPPAGGGALLALMLFACSVIEYAIWFWWCDRAPRTPRAAVKTLGLLSVYYAATAALVMLFPADYSPSGADYPRFAGDVVLLDFGWWHWTMFSPMQPAFWNVPVVALLVTVPFVLIAYGFHHMARLVRGDATPAAHTG